MYGVYLNKIHVFCYITSETAVTLSVMVDKIRVDVGAPRHLPHPPISNRRRQCLLDEKNRVLVVMMWLHQYLKLHVLVYIFNISKSKVAEEIYHIVPIIVHYRIYISWHNLKNRQNFLDKDPQYPNVVGMIDTTARKIRCPLGPRQV